MSTRGKGLNVEPSPPAYARASRAGDHVVRGQHWRACAPHGALEWRDPRLRQAAALTGAVSSLALYEPVAGELTRFFEAAV
jgi:hypothetical protein